MKGLRKKAEKWPFISYFQWASALWYRFRFYTPFVYALLLCIVAKIWHLRLQNLLLFDAIAPLDEGAI
jgi:hypothetical protein